MRSWVFVMWIHGWWIRNLEWLLQMAIYMSWAWNIQHPSHSHRAESRKEPNCLTELRFVALSVSTHTRAKLSQIADLDRTFSRNIGVWLKKKKTMKVSNSTRDNFSPDWYYKREKWTGQHHRALGIISRPRNCKWVTGEEKWIHHETQKADSTDSTN